MKKKNKIIIGIILVIIFALCFIPNSNFNSKYQLEVVGTYGDNESYHPKVLSFDNAWNGFKYWMAYTPYPQGDDAKENPHIAVSNDLINWTTLINLDTPSETIPQERYNSDAHIVYNNELDRLECYWRYVDDVEDKAIMYRRYTTNGKDWSEREVAAIADPRSKKDYISPAIIFEDGIYKMWYVDKNNTIKYATSVHGTDWVDNQVIKMQYEDKTRTWHLDVIHTEKGYEMIIVAYKNWNLHNDMNLYYTHSNDGIVWDTAKVILKPSKRTSYWDNRGIYRSSFIYESGMYYLFYSGTNVNLHHGIGFMYGRDIFNLQKTNTNFKNKKQVEKLLNKINNS